MGKIRPVLTTKDVQPQLASRPTDEDLRKVVKVIKEKCNNTEMKAEKMSLSDVEKAHIKQLVDETLKDMNMENQNVFDYFNFLKFFKLLNKPHNPTSSCLDSIVSGVFVYSIKEIQDELYILQGVVTNIQRRYRRTATRKEEQESEIDSVEITIRWFAGVPDYFIGREIQATEFDSIHADNIQNKVFLTPEEAVSDYLHKKIGFLNMRLLQYQEAQKNGHAVTFTSYPN